MPALNDHSLGLFTEATYGVAGTPDHFYEWLDSSRFMYDANIIYAKGLRVGSRFPRASRAVALVPKPEVNLDFEFATRGFGNVLQAAFGTATWSAITGGGQVLATATTAGSTLPSFTAQGGLVRADGTVVAHTWRGCTVKTAEFDQSLDEILTLKLECDAKAGHVTRVVTDGATTTTSPTVTSATGAFKTSDVGAPISGAGIPVATTIIAVVNSTTITMSANATATATGVTVTIGLAYTTPTYPAGATLYSSTANPTLANVVLGGTMTVPTTTVLGSIAGGTTVLACKSWNVKLDNQVTPREAIGTRNQPTTGQRVGEFKMTIEYDQVTGLLLENAMINHTTMPLLLSAQTSEVITGTGNATFQLAIPVVDINEGAIPPPTSGGVAETEITGQILDGEVTAAQLYAAYRTVDTAL